MAEIEENAAEEIEVSNDVEDTEQITSSSGDDGIIYILANESFSAPVVKIGLVKSTEAQALRRRISGLNTAVPLPFECKKASRVSNVQHIERVLHQTFQHTKKHWRGEFFEIDWPVVAQILEWREIEDVTHFAPIQSEDDRRAIEETATVKRRAANFSFQALDINIGEELHFVDDPTKVCTVSRLKPPRVIYERQEISLSPLTAILKGWNVNYVQVQPYWSYQGETLKDRLLRLEAEADDDD